MPIENTEEVVQSIKGKPRAMIYFQRDHEQVATEIAVALRSNKKIANMTFAGLFNGPADCEACQAVAIQATAPKVHLIAKCYKERYPGAELHFFNSEGEFVEGPQIEDTKRFEMPDLKKKRNNVPVEPVAVDTAEQEAAKAALLAETGAADDANETPASTEEGPADTEAETAPETVASDEAETPDDSVAETGDDGGEVITKS